MGVWILVGWFRWRGGVLVEMESLCIVEKKWTKLQEWRGLGSVRGGGVVKRVTAVKRGGLKGLARERGGLRGIGVEAHTVVV